MASEMKQNAPAPHGRRQQGLNERRQRLVRAASELIAERDEGAFSMQELAERAGMSLATPYNLFGSKGAILYAVFEAQIRDFNRDNVWMDGKPAVERIMGVVERLVSAYSRKPHFFRNLWKAVYSLAASELQQLVQPASAHLLVPLVKGLSDDRMITPGIPSVAIETTLARIFDASFEQWASQGWSIERLRSQLRSSFALTFLGLLDPKDRDKLESIILLASNELDELEIPASAQA